MVRDETECVGLVGYTEGPLVESWFLLLGLFGDRLTENVVCASSLSPGTTMSILPNAGGEIDPCNFCITDSSAL